MTLEWDLDKINYVPWGKDTGFLIRRFSIHRISFALDEKGQARDGSATAIRPSILLPNNIAANRSKKLSRTSGGPNRNNDVLMEFYLNKVSELLFAPTLGKVNYHPTLLGQGCHQDFK